MSSRAEIEVVARAFHEREGDFGRHLHEQVEANLLATFRRTVRGRGAVVQALTSGRSVLYEAGVQRVEQLDEETLLVCGSARYPLEKGGFAQSTVWWLDEFRDGLIAHTMVFKSEDEARAAYRASRG